MPKCFVKSHGLTVELLGILGVLSHLGANGTDGGAVKCVDIVWNANGENSSLGVC
jgi:hypothetical protein